MCAFGALEALLVPPLGPWASPDAADASTASTERNLKSRPGPHPIAPRDEIQEGFARPAVAELLLLMESIVIEAVNLRFQHNSCFE